LRRVQAGSEGRNQPYIGPNVSGNGEKAMSQKAIVHKGSKPISVEQLHKKMQKRDATEHKPIVVSERLAHSPEPER
jgi:hypothetical protein